jgi:hypothetical protein
MVVLHAKPAVKLDHPLRQLVLALPDSLGRSQPITVRALAEEIAGVSLQVGLEFRVQVYATTLDEAIGKAGPLADAIASFITLVTGVGTPIVKPMLCFETTESKREREMLQFFDDVPIRNPSKRTVSPGQLMDTVDRHYKLESESIEAAERVARAIRWYRYGTGIADLFDRFNSYWIGLEALNKPLQEKLGISDDQTTCPKCKNKWVSTPTVSGIREFAGRFFSTDPSLYRRMHGLRNDVMHSKRRFDSLVGEINEITPKAGNVLLAAIYYLYGVPQPWNLPDVTYTNAFPFRLAMVAKLNSERPEDVFPSDGADPHFVAKHQVNALNLDDKDTTKANITSKFTAVIGPKCTVTSNELRVYGEGKEGSLKVESVTTECGEPGTLSQPSDQGGTLIRFFPFLTGPLALAAWFQVTTTDKGYFTYTSG